MASITDPNAQPVASLDLSHLVYPPYHGEAMHPDPTRLIVPIGSIHRDPENARLHGERNLRHLRASLRRKDRGQQTPINVDRHGKVLKGNGTHEAAELEGWTHIWIVVSGLEGIEAKVYENADNATGLSSGWDFEKLSLDLKAAKELDGTELEFSDDELAFEAHEIDPLTAATWTPGEFTGEGNDPEASNPENQNASPEGGDPHSNLDADDRADNCKPIAVTPNMRVIIDEAIERVRLISGDMSITEGKCLELICADYLGGAPNRDAALEQYEALSAERRAPVEETTE